MWKDELKKSINYVLIYRFLTENTGFAKSVTRIYKYL